MNIIISDNGKETTLTDKNSGEVIKIPRFGVWKNNNGRAEVVDVGNDVEELKSKHNLQGIAIPIVSIKSRTSEVVNEEFNSKLKNEVVQFISEISNTKYNLIFDRELRTSGRAVSIFKSKANDIQSSISEFKSKYPHLYPSIVQFVDPNTGLTVKGPKYDTTTQHSFVGKITVNSFLKPGVKQIDPNDDIQYEPRDIIEPVRESHFMTTSNLKSIIRKLILEAKLEKRKEDSEKESKNKKTTSLELEKSLITIAKKINKNIVVKIDDHGDVRVDLDGKFYVRIRPNFNNNFDVEAYRNLSDRIYAISQTFEQVKEFVKVNFSSEKDDYVTTSYKTGQTPEDKTKKSKDLPETEKVSEKEVEKSEIEVADEKSGGDERQDAPLEPVAKKIEKQSDHDVEKAKNMKKAEKMSKKVVDDDLTKDWTKKKVS